MVITEALPAARSAATPTRVSAFSEEALPDLGAMAEVIARHGALPVGQLWHPGSANRGQQVVDAVGASAVPDGLSWTVPRILADAEIEALCGEYAETARRLQRAGFAGVEVSAAHGFLPLQFLSPVSNLRQDRWGGDLWNRSRFLRTILALIRERCGPGFLVGLKMPADDGVAGSIDPEEAARITALIARKRRRTGSATARAPMAGRSACMRRTSMRRRCPTAPYGVGCGRRQVACRWPPWRASTTPPPPRSCWLPAMPTW
ncbi:hypothetical protein ACFQU7_39660 [Pseudoroseomonas wenyumeiae]